MPRITLSFNPTETEVLDFSTFLGWQETVDGQPNPVTRLQCCVDYVTSRVGWVLSPVVEQTINQQKELERRQEIEEAQAALIARLEVEVE